MSTGALIEAPVDNRTIKERLVPWSGHGITI